MTATVVGYPGSVSRWKPNAHERLELAALELYSSKGFEQTTVEEIAQQAGLTERTFFRYFADKREVLFGNAGELRDLLCRSIDAAPSGSAPLEAVMFALSQAATHVFPEQRHASNRLRHDIIASQASLQERELIKLGGLSAALSERLRLRSVPEATAGLAADLGILVFKTAYARWMREAGSLEALLARVLDELREAAATQRPAALAR